MGLPHFLKDEPSNFVQIVEATDDENKYTKGVKVGVAIVKEGDDIISAAVVLEEAVVLCDLDEIPNAIAMLMGLLYALNIDYPKELKYTFQIIQRVLVNIGAGQFSSVVHGLCNRLLRKKL